MKTRVVYQLFKDNPVLGWLFIIIVLSFLLYAVIKSYYNKDYRKNFITESLSFGVHLTILFSFVFLFGYTVSYFSLAENNILIFILLLLLLIGTIGIIMIKLDDFSIKSLKWPILFFLGYFLILQTAIYYESKYTDRYYLSGKIKYRDGNYKDAIQDFDIQIDYHNELDSSNFYKGLCLLKLQNFDDAVNAFEKNPKDTLYKHLIFKETLELGLKYLNSIINNESLENNNDSINWNIINSKYKDDLLDRLSNSYTVPDSTNNLNGLNNLYNLNDIWYKFINISTMIAITNNKEIISNEYELFHLINLLSGINNITINEVIDNYFTSYFKDAYLNKLINKAIWKKHLILTEVYYKNDNKNYKDERIAFERSVINYLAKKTSP